MPRVRQEDDNLWMVYPALKPRPHFLNRTALAVLESCNGTHTVENLVDELRSKFDDAPVERLETDVKRCLHLFRTLGLVDWEPRAAPVETADGVRVADERDFGRIAEFIRERTAPEAKQGPFRLNYLSIEGAVDRVYQDIAIRTRQFHFVEIFFVLEHEGKLRAVSALRPSSSVGQTMLFSVLLVDGGDDGVDIARRMIRSTVELAANLSVVRVKMTLREEVLQDPQRALLEEIGFSFEARLLDELGDGEHVELWSRRAST
jgi:N-acetylglutamate synthase-like GNAT family acetyltransferase